MKEKYDKLVYMYVLGNGNKYIGQTNNLKRRMADGFGGQYNKFLINTKNKHGILRIEILGRSLNKEQANKCEINAIKKYNTLNIKYGGSNPYGLNMDKGGGMPPTLKGVNHPNALLTYLQVCDIKIRLFCGDPQADIADDFGVSKSLISAINNRKKYDELDSTEPINSNYRSGNKKGFLHSKKWKKNHSNTMKGSKHPMWNKDKELKMNTIIWAFIIEDNRFIKQQDILDKYNSDTKPSCFCMYKRGRAIGDIYLEELKLTADYLKLNYPHLIDNYF